MNKGFSLSLSLMTDLFTFVYSILFCTILIFFLCFREVHIKLKCDDTKYPGDTGDGVVVLDSNRYVRFLVFINI